MMTSLNWYTLFTKCGRWLRLNGTGGFRPCVMWHRAAGWMICGTVPLAEWYVPPCCWLNDSNTVPLAEWYVTLCCWLNYIPQRTAWSLKTKELQSFAMPGTRHLTKHHIPKTWILGNTAVTVTRRTFRLNSAVQAVRHKKPFCALPIATSADLQRY